jgi:hypothetical protein
MGMNLYLWKAPVVDDPDEAARLVDAYENHGDESAFESSADVVAVAKELQRRFPNSMEAPWDVPGTNVDRIIALSMPWGTDDAVLDAIVELARKHGLVLYDPQGPDVSLPTDPIDTGPEPPPRFVDYLKIVLIGVAAGGVFWLGWWIDVPILDWVLMIVGGFFVSVVLFLLYLLVFPPKDDKATKRPAT